jgi:branched-chain amino acid transport system ATP-binding protein
MSEAILDGQGLYKSYGSIAVLKDVGITVQRGETHAVIGPNGAGKTTLFKVLSGEVLPDQGEIRFEDQRVERIDGFQRVRRGMGRTFQVARVFAEGTVLDNLVLSVEARRQTQGKQKVTLWKARPDAGTLSEAMDLLRQVGLIGQAHVSAGVLAYGDRKRLELLMCLALQPTLLLLDEPMAGMSPADRSAAVKLIGDIARERHMSVLLTEHDMNVVFALATRITVLHHGEILVSGTPEEVRASPRVREVYLGQEAGHA